MALAGTAVIWEGQRGQLGMNVQDGSLAWLLVESSARAVDQNVFVGFSLHAAGFQVEDLKIKYPKDPGNEVSCDLALAVSDITSAISVDQTNH